MAGLFNPWYQITTFIAFVLMLLPWKWHWKAKNTGTLLYMGWVGTANLIAFINGVIWRDNVLNVAPFWCDLTTKILVGVAIGGPCAMLCINRRLYLIANVSSVSISPQQKRREVLIDLLIGIGFPIIIMGTHVVVQGNRYNLVEGFGCTIVTWNTWPAYPLYLAWPLIISLASIVYMTLALRLFLKRRHSFEEFLTSTNSGINVNRYLRLMSFAGVELVLVTPIQIYYLVHNLIDVPMYPWISWDETHWGFNRADLVPALFILRNDNLRIGWGIACFSYPIAAYVFFLFFGLGREQRNAYANVFWLCLKPFGIRPPAPKPYGHHSWWRRLLGLKPAQHGTNINSRGGTDSLPTFIRPTQSGVSGPTSTLDKPSRRARLDSMDSFGALDISDAQMLKEKDLKKYNPGAVADDTSSVEFDEKEGGSSAGGSSTFGNRSPRGSVEITTGSATQTPAQPKDQVTLEPPPRAI